MQNKAQQTQTNPQISPIIESILNAIQQITIILQHTPVISIETVKKFGDKQLELNGLCDQVVLRHLRECCLVRGVVCQGREWVGGNDGDGGDGFVVTYEPLNGGDVIDTNFSVGSIFSVWPYDGQKLIGKKIGSQVNAVLAIYGPRTTAIFYNQQQNKVQQLTMIQGQWSLSHQHCTIAPKTNIFSPSNIRAASENEQYRQIFNKWLMRGFTLRYTGSMVPDVSQIFIKGHGVFCCVQSKKFKGKLRVLYEVAGVGFLIEKAGGKTITKGKIPISEYVISSYDQKIPFAAGSADEIEMLSVLF